eukprot:COSAG01_NODE_40139_length_467_cov_1.035326_1_plen_41_part_10
MWLAEPVHAALPRSGVVDVLSRTIGDYGATPYGSIPHWLVH